MRRWIGLMAAGLALVGAHAPVAQACGGFFCGRAPVDQTAERILFSVGESSTTMITQITYTGDAEDFAWVLPLPEVPDPESLDTFPQLALNALDANTAPVFSQPCLVAASADSTADAGLAAPESEDDGVTVHVRQVVGDYDVAVIESADPELLVQWLRDNNYRITSSMEPYIDIYTEEGMKFLALKLVNGADVSDIVPFQLELPGTSPSIPLRMTALAAEPEMGVLAMILGPQRYGPANWTEVDIDDADIRMEGRWGGRTNWTSLVAKAVDEVGGKGWETEYAGPTDPLRNRLMNGFNQTEEQQAAADALLEVMQGRPYFTRMYTRLSAEEMTDDPIFRKHDGDDVDNFHTVGDATCEPFPEPLPCEMTTCGASGVCRPIEPGDGGVALSQSGCACAPGTTARTSFDPEGNVTVVCQDMRMSFLNPGDRQGEAGEPLPDPCADFDCGEHGQCVSMNMTPTCVCDEGYVAVGMLGAAGQRLTECVLPSEPVPGDLYDSMPPDLPEDLPGGRSDVTVMPAPSDAKLADATGEGTGGDGSTSTMMGGGGGSCAVEGASARDGLWMLSLLALIPLLRRRRRV